MVEHARGWDRGRGRGVCESGSESTLVGGEEMSPQSRVRAGRIRARTMASRITTSRDEYEANRERILFHK
ncbi:hypothetical protein H6P81_002584 [Aristolochia fimbriata]|uniref:Uncharacterized protein n=1 Tax=Aristolochia fimbriata TaxID=158543 RepID=A0AAV7FBC3_ARIFI|nr:hypothetical protein H6P81_002584 [Aristolochia fimbriata]